MFLLAVNVNLLGVAKTKTSIDRLTGVLCQQDISFMPSDQ